MTFKKLLPFICLTIMVFAGMAYAQIPNGGHYHGSAELDDKGEPYSSKYWSGLPNDNVISLVRKPELTEDQFILRITNPYVVNGCAELSNYGYSAEYRDIYLDIAVEGITVDMRSQPQYAHYQCNQNTQMPVADIVMNRQDIISNETQQIRLHNGNDTNYYNVMLSDNMVKILPDSGDVSLARRFKPHHIPGKKTSLLYWFYPIGTIVMWVPGGENDPDITGKLRSFAKTKNLVPLETIYPDFESPLTDTQYQYFVDTTGQFADNNTELVNGKPVGNIFVDKTVYGLEKDEIELGEMTVYAKTPGMYE